MFFNLFPKFCTQWVACLGGSYRKGIMNLNEKKPNKWWTEPDTFAMLALIERMGLVHELDKKRQRNESLFRRLRMNLAKRGIHFTVTQIRNRWKSLKHKYRKIKLASYRSPAARLSAIESFRYFHMLDHMLVRRPKTGNEEDELADDPVGRSLADLDDHADSTVAISYLSLNFWHPLMDAGLLLMLMSFSSWMTFFLRWNTKLDVGLRSKSHETKIWKDLSTTVALYSKAWKIIRNIVTQFSVS